MDLGLASTFKAPKMKILEFAYNLDPEEVPSDKQSLLGPVVQK